MIPVTTFAGRRVAVFGLGASGNATALALIAGGAQVAAWDDGAASRENAARAGVPLVDLAAADWSTFSTLVLAPGVPLTHPQPHWVVLKARQESAKREKACAVGIEVIGDIELFFRERAAVCPSAPVIAITGTNGKSTTTALIAHILKASGLDAQMGGNIGRAVLTLAPFFAPSAAHPQPARAPSAAHGPDAKWASEGPTKRPDAKWASEGPTVNRRIYVLELSSFQIDLTTDAFLEPTVGVLLNVTPDHLDRHGPADDAETAMRTYAAIKERLVSGAQATAIGIEDAFTRAALERLDERGADTYPFTTGKGAAIIPRLYAIGSTLFVHEQHRTHASSTALVSLDGVGTLRGRHNVQNALAALAALRALQGCLDGPSPDPDTKRLSAFASAIKTYPGLPHRMEQVGRSGRVLFINDSKATNADSTEKALASFERDIFWILGGKPKDGGITSLAPYFPRIAKAYLIGEAADAFAATLEGQAPYVRCGTLETAVTQAAADAALSPAAEAIVLLSPACASYDQFKSFEHRGNIFRDVVRALVAGGGA